MVYVHAQYVEGAGRWGQWREVRKNGGKPITPPATGAEIRYTGQGIRPDEVKAVRTL